MLGCAEGVALGLASSRWVESGSSSWLPVWIEGGPTRMHSVEQLSLWMCVRTKKKRVRIAASNKQVAMYSWGFKRTNPKDQAKANTGTTELQSTHLRAFPCGTRNSSMKETCDGDSSGP
jgi:hypothetical protein